MATQITPKGSLTFTVDGGAGSISNMTPAGLMFDFSATPKYHDERQTLSTAYSDATLGDVGWTNVTWAIFKNHSSDGTGAEYINMVLPPTFVAGGTSAGTVSGASVPNTLAGAGYYQEITTAGTSQGKTWAVGDYAVYLGTSGAYLQLRPKGIKMLPGETAGPFRIIGDGNAWRVIAGSGTPQLGKVAVGALA